MVFQHTNTTVEKRLAWFREARFGMFIHWGIYAIPARGEWTYANDPWKEGKYEALAKVFNPTRYDPREWARLAKRADGQWCRDLVADRGPNRLVFDLPWCRFSIAYPDGAIVEPGKPIRLGLRVECGHEEGTSLHLRWHLPEGWTASPGPSQALMLCLVPKTNLEITLTPGPMENAFEYIPLEARLSNRRAPVFLTVPFRLKDSAVATTWRDWGAVARMAKMRGESFR